MAFYDSIVDLLGITPNNATGDKQTFASGGETTDNSSGGLSGLIDSVLNYANKGVDFYNSLNQADGAQALGDTNQSQVNQAASGQAIPSWVWFAGGGGILLLIVFLLSKR